MAIEIKPILVLKNTTEDTLIITEEQKGSEAAVTNCKLQRLAATVPRPHIGRIVVDAAIRTG